LRRLNMRKTSVKLIIGAVAAALLAVWLSPALAAAQETQAGPQATRERPGRMLAREALDLTAEQEKALRDLRGARAEERKAFRDEMTRLRAEMRELAKDPQANQAKLDTRIDRTAKLRAEREKAAFRDRIERDKIFTPEQREKMRSFRERLADRPGRIGRGRMAAGRLGFGRPDRFLGPGFRPERLARLRAMRRHLLFRRWRDR
jgi:Spy/CpxP family protein refolding chaperone